MTCKITLIIILKSVMRKKFIEKEKDGVKRILVKTHILKPGEDIVKVIKKYAESIIEPTDVVVIGESALAITQGRAIPVKKIKPSLLAKILWKFVRKVPYGIGLRNPYSMQAAIDEVGSLRIIFAAVLGGITRLFGRRGDFYRIAGKQTAMIDAPHTSPVPPYNECVIKGPKEPQKVVERVKRILRAECAVMDINDIGGSWVIASTKKVPVKKLEDIMRDNPMGQGKQLTPICVVKNFAKK